MVLDLSLLDQQQQCYHQASIQWIATVVEEKSLNVERLFATLDCGRSRVMMIRISCLGSSTLTGTMAGECHTVLANS